MRWPSTKNVTIAVCIWLGLVLGIGTVLFFNGLVVTRPPPTRALQEVMLLSQAVEAYRTDNGHYPTDPATTEQLRPNTSFDPAAYISSSAFLYRSLSGRKPDDTSDPGATNYAPDFFKGSHLRQTPTGQTYIVDPWGNAYGYSTFKSVHPESPDGFNATFDLWSTGNGKKKGDADKWLKNW